MGNAAEILRGIALGGHGGGADADAAGLERRAFVPGDAVLIQRNTAAVQFLLYLTSGKSGIRQIQQKQMVVRAAGNDLVAHGHELRRHRPAVGHHTVDIRLVLRGQRLLRSHRLAGDHVLQRAALHTGKYGAVHLFRQLRATEDQSAPRAAQRLVRRGRDHICQSKGAGVLPCRHQPGNVSDVRHEIRPRRLRRPGKACKVDGPAVGRRSCDDQPRLQLPRKPLHTVIVDQAVFVHIVGRYVIQPAGGIYRQSVGQVPTVGQTHGQDPVARLQQRHIRRQIGGGTAVRLHIHMVVGVKHLPPLGDAVRLQLVHHQAAAVVASLIPHLPVGGIPLGILVGQAAAHGAAYRLAGEILAGDQLHRCFLPPLLHGNIVESLGCHTHLSPRIVLLRQQLYHILCPMQASIVK